MALNQDSTQKTEDSGKGQGPRWYIIISTLAALATIASVVFLAAPSLPFLKAVPTPTVAPSPTPTPVVLTYSAPKPGPVCDTNQEVDWRPLNAVVDCRDSDVAITVRIDPSVAFRLNAEVQFVWKNHPYPQDYSAQVNISPQATSNGERVCGGLDVLGSTAGSYILLVCSNGEWHVGRYNDTGRFSLIESGLLTVKPPYRAQIHVAGQDIISSVDGTVVNMTTREAAYAQTSYLILATAQPDQIPATDRTVTSIFSNFSYSYPSLP
jgi:hypothetical protein